MYRVVRLRDMTQMLIKANKKPHYPCKINEII